MNQLITVNRDCDATLIPSGEKITLVKGPFEDTLHLEATPKEFSFIFSVFSLLIMNEISKNSILNFLETKFFFLAIIFSLIAQVGDLTISFFKRIEKVKDMGKILPGHGGIFDRIDSLMFVVIVTYVLYQLNVFT